MPKLKSGTERGDLGTINISKKQILPYKVTAFCLVETFLVGKFTYL